MHCLLLSGAAWQADADKATSGVELIQPTKSQGIVMCCCSTTELYRREGNRWRFEKTLGTICA